MPAEEGVRARSPLWVHSAATTEVVAGAESAPAQGLSTNWTGGRGASDTGALGGDFARVGRVKGADHFKWNALVEGGWAALGELSQPLKWPLALA